MDQGEICEFVGILPEVPPVLFLSYATPAIQGTVKYKSKSRTGDRARFHIDVDDGVLAIIRELRLGKAEDGRKFGMERIENGISPADGDAGGIHQLALLPKIRFMSRMYFISQFIESGERHRLLQIVFHPFVIVEFLKPAGVAASYEVIVGGESVAKNLGKYGIDKIFPGRNILGLCPQGQHKEKEEKAGNTHAP